MKSNNNINFSIYYNTLNFIKDVCLKHPQVDTITQGEVLDMDENSFPSYPFVNIMINSITIEESTSKYGIVLTSGDKVKDINFDSNEDGNTQTIPFYGTNDEVDVFANTAGILNDVISYIEKGTTAFSIEGVIEMLPFRERNKNNLAGWGATFTLVTHNDRNSCILT